MKNTVQVEPLLTRKDVCRMLQLSLPTILRLEAAGKLRPIRLGAGSVRFAKADVEAFIAASVSQC